MKSTQMSICGSLTELNPSRTVFNWLRIWRSWDKSHTIYLKWFSLKERKIKKKERMNKNKNGTSRTHHGKVAHSNKF
jgi:hypothetical protein